MSVPERYLHDGAIALRTTRLEDAEPFWALIERSRAEVAPWLPSLEAVISVAEVHEWLAEQPAAWAARETYNFAIVRHDDGTLLGSCGLSTITWHHRFANLYYWVGSAHTRQGAATRAARLCARFAFQELQLARVEIVVAEHNYASLRVAAKCGAQREGLLRHRLWNGHASQDAWMYSLIPSDLTES